MKTINLLCASLLITIGSYIHADLPPPLWQLKGFNEPESVLADPNKPLLYVSNIHGHPMKEDGQGYISLVSNNGQIIEKEWIKRLDAPKGMAIYKNLLYVADLQKLHVIDSESGQLKYSIKLYGSKMLNDVAIDNEGTVYISDLIGGGIYRLENNQVEQWISPETLPHTNGLYVLNNQLLVATWGKGMKDDFSTNELGSLYSIDPSNAKISLLKGAEHIGNLDGIGAIEDTIYVNDWLNGNLIQYKNKKAEVITNLGKHAADISIKEDMLYVPVMFDHLIKAYNLSE